MTPPPAAADLADQVRANAELKRRLEEAEETIRAISDGEIDALVVRRKVDEEIFTLQGGNDSYRAFMETMDHGAAALGARGEILYANSILRELLEKIPNEFEGRILVDQLTGDIRAQFVDLLNDSRTGKQSIEVTFNRDGDARTHRVSAAPLETGVVSGWALTFTDLTDRVRAEQSAASERAARAILASANEAVVVCGPDGRITHVNAAVSAIQDGELLGRPFHEAIKLVFPNTTGLVQAAELVEIAIGGESVQGMEAHAPRAPRVKDLLISAAPLTQAGDGAANGCVVTMVDLSQRKAAEKQQLLLMAELDHRVKNTLTLVLSILGRTREDTIDAFKEAFSGRVHALAATHNLLADKNWSNLTLTDIVTAELAPYVQVPGERVALEGCELKIAPRAAIALGLIFHELATNAAKYGSLSENRGRVTLRVTPGTEGAPAIAEWIESDGPVVTAPSRTGFGQTVIRRSLQYSEQGGAEIDFAPAGLRCSIRIPHEDLVTD